VCHWHPHFVFCAFRCSDDEHGPQLVEVPIYCADLQWICFKEDWPCLMNATVFLSLLQIWKGDEKTVPSWMSDEYGWALKFRGPWCWWHMLPDAKHRRCNPMVRCPHRSDWGSFDVYTRTIWHIRAGSEVQRALMLMSHVSWCKASTMQSIG
jgi:hypothetical protein